MTATTSPRYRAYGLHNLDKIAQLELLPADFRGHLEMAARVLPFRTNNYVVDELIDWNNIPADPMFQLTFPQPGMLPAKETMHLRTLMAERAPEARMKETVRRIQTGMNPHPADQATLNVPHLDGRPLPGLQHKYPETLLVFPREGQTCHAFCTYCFRWAQFCGIEKLRFACQDPLDPARYLDAHPEISDVLITGGDPLVMRTRALRRYIDPLLARQDDRPATIRLGTKSLAYWPYRFFADRDADDLMRLLEQIVASGRHLAIMAHFTHPRELETPAVEKAIGRLKDVGAAIRCQSPIVRHVNDSSAAWAGMWRRQVALGAVPYYMFVARDTGPEKYFRLPLARTWMIYSEALRQVSGLGRTVRGPSMSASPGKVLVDGVAEIRGERVFVLKFLQGRNPAWVNRVFFARYDDHAAWFDELKPAFGQDKFFFEADYARIKAETADALMTADRG
ncbi:MAG: lysine 2,3-aminomutase [Desulfobacteraceae bacterium]|nr:lysine 2,3-aminomutase [Desulfobacteraceae bacterium]